MLFILYGLDYWVGVAWNQSCLFILPHLCNLIKNIWVKTVFTWSGTWNEIARLIVFDDSLEKLSRLNNRRNFRVLEIEKFSGTARQINHTFIGISISQSAIVPMHFCASFLEQQYPELVTIWSWEYGSTKLRARKEIIYSDLNPLSIFAQLNPVKSIFIIFLSYK